jgi:hypothetical protein
MAIEKSLFRTAAVAAAVQQDYERRFSFAYIGDFIPSELAKHYCALLCEGDRTTTVRARLELLQVYISLYIWIW